MQNRIVDELLAASKLRDRQTDPAGESGDLNEFVREQFDRSRQTVEQYVAAHPAICLAAAAGLGIALGWWVKRK